MKKVAPKAPDKTLNQIISSAFAIAAKESMNMGFPDFPIDNLIQGAKLLESYPDLSSYNIFLRLYPYQTFLKDQIPHLEKLLATFEISLETATLPKINIVKNGSYVETNYQNKIIEGMLQSSQVSDFCLIGPKGCGKSLLVGEVAKILGKDLENIVLYQDMTARDLIQQRTTLENGDTIWKLSPLVLAALEGKIAVLDGLHRIHPSTLSVLHRYFVYVVLRVLLII